MAGYTLGINFKRMFSNIKAAEEEGRRAGVKVGESWWPFLFRASVWDVFYLEVGTLESNRSLYAYNIQNFLIKKETMAYYVFLSNQTPFPYFFGQNMPQLSPMNMPATFYSMEHLHSVAPQTPTASVPIKLTPEVLTVAPEDANRSSQDEVHNRKKREKNLERELVSAKKNSQSNIINNFFTFFTAKESSEGVVRRVIGSLGKTAAEVQRILTIFFNIIRLINMKRGRKYISKSILWSYFTEEWLAESIDKLENMRQVSVKEISCLFRKCLHFFMNEISLTSILTSKRITKHSKEIHLNKRRKINSFFRTLSGQC